MAILDATSPIICQCNKDVVIVNQKTELENYNPVLDELEVYLMNIQDDTVSFQNPNRLTANQVNELSVQGEDISDISYIQLEIPYGEEPDSFLSQAANRITCSVTGWKASEWKDTRRGTLCCSIVSESSSVVLEQYNSIRVHIQDIESYCVPGMTYMIVSFQNINGLRNMKKRIALEKRIASLQINEFFPDKCVITRGEKIGVHWSTCANTYGKIHPNEFHITKGVKELTDTPLQTTHYTLEAGDELHHISSQCSVYVMWPVIERFEVDEKNIYWNVLYSDKVHLNGSDEETSGQKERDKAGEFKYVLSCEGYLFQIEQSIYTGYEQWFSKLQKTVREFSGYTVTKLSWESSSQVQSIVLGISDHGWNRTELDTKGEFEYTVSGNAPEMYLEVVNDKQVMTRIQL